MTLCTRVHGNFICSRHYPNGDWGIRVVGPRGEYSDRMLCEDKDFVPTLTELMERIHEENSDE